MCQAADPEVHGLPRLAAAVSVAVGQCLCKVRIQNTYRAIPVNKDTPPWKNTN